MSLLLGADPEVFVKNKQGFVSAYNMVKGTKKAPHPVTDGAVQVDGMALEFNITPAKSAKAFSHKIQSVMKTLENMIPEEHVLDIKSSVKFDEAFLKAQPEEATELGCDPDYNAYSLEANPRPDGAALLRTAAGHVHIGWKRKADVNDIFHILDCATLVKELDIYLGLPSLFIDVHGGTRRQLYGKAGAMRIKPYGVEYRVLSNFWLQSPELMEWVFDSVALAVSNMKKGIILQKTHANNAKYYMDLGLHSKDLAYYYTSLTTAWQHSLFDHILPFQHFTPFK